MAFLKSKAEHATRRFRGPGKYVRLDEDVPVVVQILEDMAHEYYKFWFRDSQNRWVSYVSPGYNECPITQRNIIVGKESKDYIRANKKAAVNVWDISPVIRCSECSTAHLPNTLSTDTENPCSKCEVNLNSVEPTPFNEVRILERGSMLFTQLETLAGDPDGDPPVLPMVLNSEGKHLRITQYPMTIVRTGTGNNTSYTVIAHPDHASTVDAEACATDSGLHVLPDMGLNLTSEEILAIINDRVPLADILAARNAESKAEDVKDTDVLF